MEIIRNFPCLSILLAMFSAIISSALKGAAARRLNVSRQAVSVAMGNLEKDLGFPFFKKGNKGIRIKREKR